MSVDMDSHALETGAADLLGAPVRIASVLAGGQHAATVVVTDGVRDSVLRVFPAGDPAVEQEVRVLAQLGPLGELAPRVVADGVIAGHPAIVTTRLPGGFPDEDLSAFAIARRMADALARIHALDPSPLRRIDERPPDGESPIAARSRAEWSDLDHADLVFTHTDFWCGNALWRGEDLTGIVDWSGARRSPRGIDVAWCRQDLVLLGSVEAADVFLSEYERISGHRVADVRGWDVHAAARAVDRVETWEPNYLGIGRTSVTAQVLRQRLDAWIASL